MRFKLKINIKKMERHQNIPTNFYDLQLKAAKRNTNFSVIAKKLLDNTTEKNIEKQHLEERLIEENGKDIEDQLKVY